MGFKALVIAAALLLADAAQAITQIACLGDSITYTAPTRATKPYPHQLENQLNALYPGEYAVANYGTGGHRSDQNLTTWTNNIRGRGFDVLVLLTGINDIVQNVAAATIWGNINTIVDQAKSDGLTVILITITPFGTYIDWTAPRQAVLDAVLVDIRAEPGVTVLDLYPSWETSPGSGDLLGIYDFGDGLHPGEVGVAALATAVHGAYIP